MISTKNLSVGYGNNVVLSDINVDFKSGEFTVLLGPNGCGKSTLIKTVLGLQDKISGEIFVDGVEAEQLDRREFAQKASYMPQSRPTPNISAMRMVLHGRFPYLSFPRHYRKEDFEIAKKALERVDASELANSYMPQLSGGQKQKIYLAMVLAQDTDTIFMDEPTTFLDIEHQLQVMENIRTLVNEGKSVVMVLHDIAMAMRYADRILLFNKGSLFAQGTPEEIYSSGHIEKVFNIGLKRVNTEDGWQYYYDKAATNRG